MVADAAAHEDWSASVTSPAHSPAQTLRNMLPPNCHAACSRVVNAMSSASRRVSTASSVESLIKRELSPRFGRLLIEPGCGRADEQQVVPPRFHAGVGGRQSMEPPHRGLSLRDELRQPRIEHGQRTVSCARALRFDAASLVGLRRLNTRRRTLRDLDGLHRRRKLRGDGGRGGDQTACPDCGQRFAKMGAPYCLVILIDDAVSIAISRR